MKKPKNIEEYLKELDDKLRKLTKLNRCVSLEEIDKIIEMIKSIELQTQNKSNNQ